MVVMLACANVGATCAALGCWLDDGVVVGRMPRGIGEAAVSSMSMGCAGSGCGSGCGVVCSVGSVVVRLMRLWVHGYDARIASALAC